ncbi:MAG: TonB-dependent receptor [Phycisphaerae bacterium]|nr:TonB-dependent receptor [Gemmatimonadaceae bacterium]
MRRWYPLLLLGPAMSGLLSAQQTPPKDSAGKAIAPVIVNARQVPRVIGGAAVLEMSTDSLRTPAGATLSDVLRTVPFVGVRTNSRGETELSVRGSDSRQPTVLLEGAPMSLGWDSRSDASVIPITGASGIRFSRTLSSLMLGTNIVGGTIEVGLLDGLSARRSVLTTGADQTGAYAVTGSFGAPISIGSGVLAVTAGAGRRDRPDLVAPPGADNLSEDGRRRNTYFEQTDYFGAARFTGKTGAFLGATLTGNIGRRGIAPEAHLAAPRFWQIPQIDRQVAILAAGTGKLGTPLGAASADLRVSRNQGTTRIDAFSDNTYSAISSRERGDDATTTARLILEHTLGTRGDFGISATQAVTDYDETLDAAAAAVYQQKLTSLAMETDWRLPGLTDVSFALATDRAANAKTGGRSPLAPTSEWAGRVGLSKLFYSGFTLHSSVSRRARFPALRELYSGALNRFEPNPDLKPEKLVAAELGMSWTGNAFRFQSAVFRNSLQDAVVRTTLANRKFKRVNKNDLQSTGIELFGSWNAPRATLIADVTLQDVQLTDIASAARTRPEYAPHHRSTFTAILPLMTATRLTAAMRNTGAQYCEDPDLGRQRKLAANAYFDALVDHDIKIKRGGLWSVLKATLGIDNVGNTLAYDQCGLPRAGRTIRFGLEMR